MEAAAVARTRPDVVGGFHLLVNGLVAILTARLLGLRAWYFSVGGPVELLDGGVWGENPHFVRLRTPDPVVERRLLDAVAAADLVVTMGSGAKDFLRSRGVTTTIEIVAGGIAPATGGEAAHDRYDVVLVARLVPIKRIDRFVQLVRCLADRRPDVRAVIVGDGPLRADLERLVRDLGLESHVTFAGFQPDVVLTSRSEGLALSLMEAMTHGVPAVVPDVGDLGDLVEDGVNGFLVADADPAVMAERVLTILESEDSWRAFASRARRSAEGYSTAATTARWDRILG
jgi:L-malate glycosyltransferase